MIKLNDVLEANQLLMSMGGDDQLPRIASAAIERSLELQARVDRALAYAAEAPGNSLHAKNIARILDGSITVDDELNEVVEPRNQPRRLTAVGSTHQARKKGTKGKLSPGSGLSGRSTKERLKIREWIAEQGIDIAHSGRITQVYLDMYDDAMVKEREVRAADYRENGSASDQYPGQMSL